jgi:hypothetical protein
MTGKHGTADVLDGDGANTPQKLPLDLAWQCFTYLVSGPDPVSVDGRDFPGLPPRALPLDELRERLLKPDCPCHTRDAVWAHLVQRSRDEGATWTLACAGMALPALRGVVRWVSDRYPGEDRFDIEAEVLSGFLTGLATVDLHRPRVLVRLRWAAYRAGHAALCEALNAPRPVGPGFHSCAPRLPWGHPDFVLARAVAALVLSPAEADLISATRVGEVPLIDWAGEHGLRPGSVYKARRRAEHRLVAFLRDQALDSTPEDQDPTADSALSDPGFVRSEHHSRSGTAAPTDSQEEPVKKSGTAVSKTGPRRGLHDRGGTPPAAPSSPSSEVPRCA